MPSAARSGCTSSRKQRCCSSTSSCTRDTTADIVSVGVRPSGPVSWSPEWIRRFSSATRIMKNSSRFELKMERNFTRSSKGTLGSCASSSTRRLNSSHDKSRLTNASGPISPSTVERFVEEEPVAHPSGADDEVEISAEEHGLLDNHGAGEDDVNPLRFEPPDLSSLPRGEPLQALPDRRDVGLPHLQAVAMLALARVRPEVNAGEGPHRPSQPHHDLPAPRGRQRLLELPS